MKVQQELIVSRFAAKVSQQGNTYFEVDLVEIIETDNSESPRIERKWSNIYHNPQVKPEKTTELIGRRAAVELNFYTSERKHGEKTYTDIKCNLVSIKEL